MFTEVDETKEFFNKKFGEGNHVPYGIYAVPYKSSRGDCFSRVKVTHDGKMSDFNLFWDEEFKISWYTHNKDGSPKNGVVA